MEWVSTILNILILDTELPHWCICGCNSSCLRLPEDGTSVLKCVGVIKIYVQSVILLHAFVGKCDSHARRLESSVTLLLETLVLHEYYLPDRIQSQGIRRCIPFGKVGIWIQSQFCISCYNINGVAFCWPTGAKDIHWSGEYIIVNNSCVNWEETHQQDDVAARKEDVPDLVEQNNTIYMTSISTLSSPGIGLLEDKIYPQTCLV